MDCQKCKNLMDSFITGGLNAEDTDDFVRHVVSCSDCMEELKVSYSLLTALDQLDHGDELSEDYEYELEQKIKRYLEKKRRRKIFTAVMYVVCFIVSLVLTVFFLMAIGKRSPQEPETPPVYSLNELDTKVVIGYDGVPDTMNAVKKKIYSLNDIIIDYLHSEEEV